MHSKTNFSKNNSSGNVKQLSIGIYNITFMYNAANHKTVQNEI
jgi:hypothetical protein